MTYSNFRIQLAIGQRWERVASTKLIQYYKSKHAKEYTVLSTNNDNRYDFILSNNRSYEVKYDNMAAKTNNVFIEFEGYGKPSGIDVSLANFYIIIVPFTTILMLKIKASRLKTLIKKGLYRRIYSDIEKKGYIFDISVICANSINICNK